MENDIFTEEKALIETQFSFKQDVKITKGFYKGFYGIVKDVMQIKEEIIYTVELQTTDTKKKVVDVKEDYLIKRPLLLGMFKV